MSGSASTLSPLPEATAARESFGVNVLRGTFLSNRDGV